MEIRKLVSYTVVDEDLVPRELCEPSKTKINELIKTGIDKIPGIEIFEEISLVNKEPVKTKDNQMAGVIDD